MNDHDPTNGPNTPTPGRQVGGLLAQLLDTDTDDFDDADDSGPPVHWPSLTQGEAAGEWRALYEWTTTLQRRFRGMVRLPACWYRHNDLVEALSALRDHERASYADTAAPTAAVAWHNAFRDIETRLRTWIAELRCGGDLNYHDRFIHTASAPDLTPPADFPAWITQDQGCRDRAAIRSALAGGATHNIENQAER